MLQVEAGMYPAPLGKAHTNLSNAMRGEAKVNLPLALSLPADPLQWTRRQAQNWLCWLREANDIDELDITEFNTDGPGLCSLTLQQIEQMVGLRAGNIFRSTLDMLQSTAALIRHSPPASLTPPPPESPDTLPDTSRMEQQLHYQTPCTMPTYNRSSVITSADIARLQPIAQSENSISVSSTGNIKIEGRRASSECESIEEDEETVYGKFFQPEINATKQTAITTRPLSNGIDCGRQGVTLWQFILELLADKECGHIVTWTENHLEFKVMNSREMANRWGARKNRPKMNYDKLSRALRYYYRKNLIQHVPGKRQVYFFVEHPESLDFTQLLNTALRTHPLRNQRPNSAFTHLGGAIKRLSPPGDLEREIKKSRHLDQGPLSMLGYPGMLGPVNQLLSIQSPLISPTSPLNKHFYLSKIENLDFLRQAGQLEYQRLTAIHAALVPTQTVLAPTQATLEVVPCTALPPLTPKPGVVHKISVLDTGSIKMGPLKRSI